MWVKYYFDLLQLRYGPENYDCEREDREKISDTARGDTSKTLL